MTRQTADRPLRLAMFSPVPPIPSGISAYLADLLPLLPRAWSIDVFTDEGIDADLVACFPHTEFASREARDPYDLTIYQVGNTTARVYMLEYAMAHPGLLVLHDGVLHPARVEAAVAAGDIRAYRRAAAGCREDVGAALGHLVAAGLGGPALYRAFPLCEDLVRSSRATAMHGELACGWLRGLVPGARVVPLVHWRSVEFDDAARATWRRRLGGDEAVIMGSFGNIGPERRLDRLFRVLAELDPAIPWRLVIAGGVAPGLGLETLAAELGIAARVSLHAGLGNADFVAVMASVDLAVHLRYPAARASSGVLHQLLQLGVPTAISDVVHWREYPEAAVLRVPPGPDVVEHEVLRDGLAEWLRDDARRAAVGTAARDWAAGHLTPEKMRDSYVAAVAAALRRGSANGSVSRREGRPGEERL